MRALVGLALLWSVSAHAGGWEPGRTWTVDVPGDAHQAIPTRINGKPRIVVTGSFGTWTVDPSVGVSVHKSAMKGKGLWVDSEYDATWPDVMVCNERGVSLLPTEASGFGEATELILKPCHTIALVDVTFQDYGAPITARDSVWLWSEDASGYLRPKTQLGTLKNPAAISVHKDQAAFAGLGDDRVYLLRDNAIVRQPAGGFVGGLAWAKDRWAWTLTDAGVVQLEGGVRLRVAETPTRLASGDLNGDGKTSFLVAHPRTLSLGVVAEHQPEERVFPVDVEPIALSVGEWSGDNCADVVVIANERKILLIQGQCTAEVATTPVATPEAPDTSTAESSTPTVDEPASTAETATDVDKPRGVQTLPSGPEVPLAMPADDGAPTEAAVTGSAELHVGAGNWPVLTLKVGETRDMQLVDPMGQATAFVAMGGPPGFVVRSNGTAEFTPKITHVGRWRVAVRLWENGAWGRRGGFELVIEKGAVESEASGQPVAATESASSDKEVKPEVKDSGRAAELVGCDLGLGIAAGFTDVSENWTFINQSIQESASPMISFACQDGRSRGYWWFAGADSAPTFVFFNNDRRHRHTIAATVGVGVGNRIFRAGVYGTIGFTLVGAGARLVWYPIKGKNQLRHGFDLRATVFSQSQFAGQVSLMYSMYLGDLWR